MYKSTLLFLCLFILISGKSQDNVKFENSYWEWVEGSGITDKRLDEVAPHFPKPKDYNFDLKKYEEAIFKWQKLYCFEYEAFVNAPELTKLNPYYKGYQNIIDMPYFIMPLESYEKPLKPEKFSNFEDELDFELKLQAWYFVFSPEEFNHIYRIKPEFPSWFNAEVYRKAIVDKIEATKEAEKKGLKPDYN
ncbi:MAG: hypothetical protein KDE33_16340 [Bacteroidetes bacterium]|nr:hypothetical protein [Bacteroidota bacterium]MCB9227923.1 hypothetical protein [Chitinophagales bacterium]